MPGEKPATVVRYRSAITGRWVSKAYAQVHPDTTVSVTLKRAA